jgi:nucleotide-binding universal stress UspA family protein
MYRRVLLAFDGTVEGRVALREGARIGQICGAEVFLLAVVDLTPAIVSEMASAGSVAQQDSQYEAIAAEGARRLEVLGFAPQKRLATGDPAQQIGMVASEIGADTLGLSVIGITLHSRGGGSGPSQNTLSTTPSAACWLPGWRLVMRSLPQSQLPRPRGAVLVRLARAAHRGPSHGLSAVL